MFVVIKVGNYKLKYNFESNSQRSNTTRRFPDVGNYKLKYNFESNSQQGIFFGSNVKVGNYKLKYNFESNSQLLNTVFVQSNRWEL